VHNLTFTSVCGSVYHKDPPVYRVLAYMPNVQSLSVYCEGSKHHTPLLHAISKFQRLEEVTLEGWCSSSALDWMDSPHVLSTFLHKLLHTVLDFHSIRLKALHIYTRLHLNNAIYGRIRDETPNLRSVTFTGNITVQLQEQFASNTPWASGETGSLESLTLQDCGGVHSGSFAMNLLRGVYGTQLKSVQIIACGAFTDIPFSPPRSTPTNVSITRFQIDHPTAWELEALASIPAQELSLTLLRPENFVQLPMLLGGSTEGNQGFKGLKVLRLNPAVALCGAWDSFTAESKVAYSELTEVCLPQRGIQLRLDAAACPGICTSHPHI
jgi:hypothetical protein